MMVTEPIRHQVKAAVAQAEKLQQQLFGGDHSAKETEHRTGAAVTLTMSTLRCWSTALTTGEQLHLLAKDKIATKGRGSLLTINVYY